MPADNKRNIQYFEARTMSELHESMQAWQMEHQKRLLSVSIQPDAGKFCCIALTNPTEVMIVGANGVRADVDGEGCLWVRQQ